MLSFHELCSSGLCCKVHHLDLRTLYVHMINNSFLENKQAKKIHHF
jgi:hypothetical protein